MSLNYDSPELRKIMPWAGTKCGRQAFIDNFTGVTTRWQNEAFDITTRIEQGQRVALSGVFTQRSVTLSKVVTSALVVIATVVDDRITFFQYMEDTFATALSFRSGGQWSIRADPKSDTPIDV